MELPVQSRSQFANKMKPPDPLRPIVLRCVLVLLFIGVQVSAQTFPSEQTPALPPPPLLNVNVPANSFARLDVDVSKLQAKSPPVTVSSATSTITSATDAKFSFKDRSTATLDNGTGLQLNGENIFSAEDVVTRTSVQGSVTELIGNDTEVAVDEVQPVTRTSLKVSEVELGVNGEVVGAVSEADLQDAVTQTSVKITQQEVQANQTERNSTLVKGNVENIQEILKQIQNEVGEARILYVADPKAKTGMCSRLFFFRRNPS